MFRAILPLFLLVSMAWGLSIGTDDAGDVEVTEDEYASEDSGAEEGDDWTSDEMAEGWTGTSSTGAEDLSFDDMKFHHKKFEDPRQKIAPGSSPFYSLKQTKRFKLGYEEFMSHPIMERYFRHNHKLAVVPEKAVQQELLEKILPELSPYGKLTLMQVDLPVEFSVSEEASAAKVQKVKAHMSELEARFKCVRDYLQVVLQNDKTLRSNYLYPYAGLQFWLSVNSNDTMVRDTVTEHMNMFFKDYAGDGFHNLDALSKPAYQYLPVLFDSLFIMSKNRKQFDVGDVGKNIIVGNQHNSMSGWVDFKQNEAEGERCQVNNYNLADEADAYSSDGTSAVVNKKVFQSCSPVWQRFNFILYQTRKQHDKVNLKEIDNRLADFKAVNQECKVVINAKAGKGKTWEKQCMLGSDTLEFLKQRARKADSNGDEELSFEEYLHLMADIKRVFQVIAPNSHGPTKQQSWFEKLGF